jgi:hypothetical protein
VYAKMDIFGVLQKDYVEEIVLAYHILILQKLLLIQIFVSVHMVSFGMAQ